MLLAGFRPDLYGDNLLRRGGRESASSIDHRLIGHAIIAGRMTNIAALEPISTGDIIDRAVRLYRRNFAALISVVAVPSLIGYLASTMFWFGYSKLIFGITTGPSLSAILMVAIGSAFYPVWYMALLTAIAGMSRVVGDHVVLGETITFRKCLNAIRRRLGDVLLMGLLAIAIAIGLYTVFSVVVFAVAMIFLVVIAVAGAAGPGGALPEWFVGIVVGVALLGLLIGTIILLLAILSRVIFLPQVVMIEGSSAGNALGRAFRLGAGNWYKLGGIGLFAYFVTGSLLAALTLPFIAVLYVTGSLNESLLASPAWMIFYSAFGEITNVLVLPIWIVAFTLLYFDSRVRKEGYDVELLTRNIAPGFQWQPAAQYRRSQQPSLTNTGAPGLGAYAPAGAPVNATERQVCYKCSTPLERLARFCHVCGSSTGERGADAS